MSKQDNKHIGTFRQDKLMPEETLEADIKGWLDKRSGQGGLIQHKGQFVLTNKRACFYSKAPFEEIFETIPLSKITSVGLVADGLPCAPCSHGWGRSRIQDP